ncbi:penicillin-binding protein 2 [Metallumcola ferriviriculae]|uniref:Penicillin-binding protein 2 n=1 Tax=Metallumcola ferriviriculae TaxID=3039180 RepID=A0AAU0USF9_9FIRM|nr:penicillin-binding protein 2 [Desulfitibacteraceae bacterium MK1]
MRRRLNVVFSILILVGLFLAGRLILIQLVDGDGLSQQAALMQQRYIRNEPVPRGDVLDRNLTSLTDTRTGLALMVFPNLLKNMDLVSQEIRSVFGEIYNIDQLTAAENWEEPVVLNTFTSFEKVAKIQDLNLPGVFIVPLTIRYGPDSLARHLVGHLTSGKEGSAPVFGQTGSMSKQKPDYTGSSGIEKRYDPELSYGESSSLWSLFFDARGNLVPGLSFDKVERKQQSERYSVVLTVDGNLQAEVESIMDKTVAQGAVVVMDAGTGAVLAAASRPNYRQDRVGQVLDAEGAPLLNRIFNSYYPGSIFKIVVAAAALEEGLVSPQEIFNCTGNYQFDSGLEIPCWNTDGHGELTFAEALGFSCNPTFIEVALRLGRSKLLEYARAFGLEKELVTGYALPGYNSLNVGYSAGDLGNAAVGQKGVHVSPLQIAAMTSVVASGGIFHTPKLVEGVVDGNGRVLENVLQGEEKRIISAETARTVQAMMKLTTTIGTGKSAWIPEGAAGKTSSAETGQVDEQGRQIINAWFTGFIPLEHPKYVITVLVEGGNYGGKVAAPIFREIAEYLLGAKDS